jgi:hypothetical protein
LESVEDIERLELLAMTLRDHWHQLNALARFAIERGMEKDKNDGEMEVILRWAEIKT